MNNARRQHPAPIPTTEIAFECKLTSPHDDDSVNIILGPLPEKRVEVCCARPTSPRSSSVPNFHSMALAANPDAIDAAVEVG